MKTILIAFAAVGLLCTRSKASAGTVATNAPPVGAGPLVARHDLNGNGKIDVDERQGYMRDMARLRREEAQTLAAQRPVLSPQERLFYRPPRLTPELVSRYDTNQNGKLDLPEHLA